MGFQPRKSQHLFASGMGVGVDIDQDDCLKLYLDYAPYQDNLYIVLYQELS